MTLSVSSTPATLPLFPLLTIAPAQVIRGSGVVAQAGAAIRQLGVRPVIIGGEQALTALQATLVPDLKQQKLKWLAAPLGKECSEPNLERIRQTVQDHSADVIIGTGGGKALDAAKLIAYQCQLPMVTIPTTGATCAAWTALSNVYTTLGAFHYDVPLPKCPDLLILDYDLVLAAPQRTLVAGIGDALAKWYEASVSSGHSQDTLIIAAVQQARVLRDILLQKAAPALAEPGSQVWREVVDATVLMAGVIGGMGGAQCRTVAAHAVHNGLTHLDPDHVSLHGEKVAYGILVQLRLEEMLMGNQLAATSRQQLLKFYEQIGLPMTLADLGLGDITLLQLQTAANVSCARNSDLHHLPFTVEPSQLMAAMISTTAPTDAPRLLATAPAASMSHPTMDLSEELP